MQKVFCIGFQKTGTTSLGEALKILGYSVHSGHRSVYKLYLNKQYNRLSQIIEQFDSFEDMPWPLLYKYLHENYPDGIFIYTFRDVDEWINSMRNHFGTLPINHHKLIYGYSIVEGNEEAFVTKYRKHMLEVEEFFRDKEAFLSIETRRLDWGPLCQILGKEIPSIPFPYLNRTPGINKFSLVRRVKSIYHFNRKRVKRLVRKWNW